MEIGILDAGEVCIWCFIYITQCIGSKGPDQSACTDFFGGGGGLRLRFSQMQSKFLAFRYTRVFLFWKINKYMNQGRQASWFTMWASFRSPCLKASGSVPVLRLLLFSAGIDPSCKGTLSRSGVGCSRSVLLIPFLLAVVKTFQQGIWMRGARASLIKILVPLETIRKIDSYWFKRSE